jgi:hypothetical protein
MRDLGGLYACLVRKLKHTVNKVLSLRDFVVYSSLLLRKLKHTVNKVLSLRDLWVITKCPLSYFFSGQ